ncbi:isochorismatase family protein [Ferrimicrobium sp.]|uniref:cysteine hydrolase family protein n=1 Tax=Ferrimicrobium sp. TaxID=2926050 RepID=UPI00262EFC90|nr:isochorismatase family protein [Ferrimicrobium sp.]
MATVRRGNKAAVLVVDVQVGVMDGTWESQRVVAKVGRVVERARAAQAPILWVQHNSADLVLGSPEWQLVPGLVPASSEVLIDKRYNSAFEGTQLETELSRIGASRLILAGAATNWCIRATAYGALDRGYDVTLVEDAHTTMTEVDGERRIEAADIVQDLNNTMMWLEYPDRVNSIAVAEEVVF